MKLILCPECNDVVKLHTEARACRCGASVGRYMKDGMHASFQGKAVPLAIDNESLSRAVRSYNGCADRKREEVFQFIAFVVPPGAKRFKRGAA